MRLKWMLALLPVVIACSGQPTAATSPPSSPSVATSPVPSADASPPSLSTVDFKCVLPVHADGANPSGFISFPARSFRPATQTGDYYDRVVSRWLPVPRQAVSPDGLRYAYTEGWSVTPSAAPRLHIVNAATRKDIRVARMPGAQPYQVVDFTSTGVYLIIAFEGIAPGVWRFDPATGGLAKISNGYYVPAGAAWIGVTDPGDPSPQTSAMDGAVVPDRIDRRDAAGAIATWFYEPGFAVSWAAFAGTPALLVSANQQDIAAGSFRQEYWLVDGPGHATRLGSSSGDRLGLSGGLGSAIADEHGIWVRGGDSLYLARRDGAILRVFDGPLYPANGCL